MSILLAPLIKSSSLTVKLERLNRGLNRLLLYEELLQSLLKYLNLLAKRLRLLVGSLIKCLHMKEKYIVE